MTSFIIMVGVNLGILLSEQSMIGLDHDECKKDHIED